MHGIEMLDTIYSSLRFIYKKQIDRQRFQFLLQSSYIGGFLIIKLIVILSNHFCDGILLR
jgi:hypothetical protein